MQSGEKSLSQAEPKLEELSSKEDTELKKPDDSSKVETTSDLSRIIEESKEKLAAEEPAPVKKRGRPKGYKVKPKETNPGDAKVEEAANALKSFLAPKYISQGFQLLGHRAAVNTGYKGWEVEPQESDQLAELADQCIMRYFPNLSDTHALLAVTIFSFGMAIGGRYMGYQDFLAEKGKKKKEDTQPVTEVSNGPDVEAASFFPQVQ